MSKASKVSHFHSTTYSAHRGGVAHATLGRPMAPSAPAPGTVGAMTPKIPSRGVSSNICQSFKNGSETLWQFANRIAPGPGGKTTKLSEIANWKILLGGRLETGITLKDAAVAIKGGTPMGAGNPAWWNATAAEMTKGASYLLPSQEPQIQVAYDYYAQSGMLTACPSGGKASFALTPTRVNGADEESDPTGVGAMTPKFKPQAQCVPFLSPSETMRQYANRVLGGSLAALDGRMLMAGKMSAGDSVGALARKSVGNRNWANVTANEVFIVAFHQPMPAGMPVSTCALTERASLDWYGVVHGAEEEPGTVGAMTPKFKYADRGSYIAFSSPDETMQQYANRVAHGSLAAIAGRQVLVGGKLEIGHIGELAKKAAASLRSPMGWGGVTVRQMYAAGGAVIVPGMPIGSWPSYDDYAAAAPKQDQSSFGSGGGKGYSLQKRGTVTGTEGTVGDFIDDAGEWVSTVVQESQNAFSNPDVGAGYQPPSANPGDNQNAAEQCAQMGPGWSWSADRNACANFEQEAAACAAAGNTWDDVAGQCRSNNCPPGSHSNPDLPGCIPDKLPCGAHSFQSGDKCLCEQGFEFKDMVSLECVPVGQGWQSAINKCGENTHTDPNVGGCVCDPGYIFDPKRTTADTLVCGKAECGSNSVFNQQDGQCHCKPGYDWVDPANIDNLDCKKAGGNGGGPVTPPAPKCGPGTHVDSATNTCVVDETAQVEPTKAEDNTWKWVAGIAAAAVVVGGGTYLAMKKQKGKKSALQTATLAILDEQT